ncbi:MAG: cupin domain-containing protein [Patescibacteria group bacterium]
MKGFVSNIEEDSLQNDNFREVLYTGTYMQLVVMSINPGEEIGEEVHGQDQFIRVEEGEGKAVLDGKEHELSDGFAVVVPAGTKHNIINTGTDSLKLYTIYAAPHHKDGVIHKTKAAAEKDKTDEFLGDTTE